MKNHIKLCILLIALFKQFYLVHIRNHRNRKK